MSPWKVGSTASSSSGVTETGCCSSTSPLVSWVLVTSPSFSPATYSFSPSLANVVHLQGEIDADGEDKKVGGQHDAFACFAVGLGNKQPLIDVMDKNSS